MIGYIGDDNMGATLERARDGLAPSTVTHHECDIRACMREHAHGLGADSTVGTSDQRVPVCQRSRRR
jgi:hypothetical protein